MRSAAGFIATLPVFTALTDAARARHGVDDLYATLRVHPQDPQQALWLAEALDRVHGDLALFGRVRSLTSPTYALRRRLLLSALELGEQPSDPVRVRLLKSAYRRSLSAVRVNSKDHEALHVLARIYLAQGDLVSAGRLAKVSILTDPSDGLAWITMARVFFVAGQYSSAKVAAERAVSAGAGYGNELLAQLVIAQTPEEAATAVAEFERLRSLVTPADRRAYFGTAVEPRAALRHVKEEQVRRAVDMLDLMRGAG